MVMPTYPGVYVEEVSSGVRPITAASTSTAAFVGQAERGTFSEAVKINNFTQYQNLYGEFIENLYLAYAVYQFFNNGGNQCYIVRVAGEGAREASVTLIDRQETSSGESLTISASSVGSWGNGLSIEITDGTRDPTNEFNLSVYRGDKIETFENLSVVSSASNFVDTVTSTSKYIRTKFIGTNAKQAGTSKSKGELDLSNGLLKTKFRINIDGDGYQEIDLQEAVTKSGVANLNTLENVATAIQFVVRGLERKLNTTESKAFSEFLCTSENNTLVLTSGSKGAASSVSVASVVDSSNDAAEQLRLGKRQGGIETLGGASARPKENPKNTQQKAILYPLGKNPLGVSNVLDLQEGSEGGSITDQSYINALKRLDDKDDVSLIAIPGVSSQAVIGGGMNYCNNRSLKDCFFIGDIPQGMQTVAEAQGHVGLLSPQNSYGAVYLPWLRMLDPTGRSSNPITVPPSGYVAGIYAKTDAQRGVWKAPAGTATALAGTVGLTVNFTDTQQGDLNPAPYNINCIRQFTGSGTVIWGARTVSSDAEWRYIPVRRMAILLRVSIYRGIQWAVFEPNDEELWSQLRLNINAFMTTLYRRGAFQGSTAKQAFFVKCDSETTTQIDIDNGIVNVLVGFAPLKPAEFVMVKISQKAGQIA